MKLKVSDILLHWHRARGEIRWSVGVIKNTFRGKLLPVDGNTYPPIHSSSQILTIFTPNTDWT